MRSSSACALPRSIPSIGTSCEVRRFSFARRLGSGRRVLAPGGTYVVVGGPLAVVKALMASRFVREKLLAVTASVKAADLMALKELIATNQVTPVIDRRYPLSEISAAIGYLEQGHARGKIVIVP
jgi:D-arabinose 1-dehydrogenase-like Zn-dependent alcohol dehydrogenase